MEDLGGVCMASGVGDGFLLLKKLSQSGLPLLSCSFFPDYPGTCKKLTPEERDIAIQRLLRIGMLTKADSESKLGLKETMIAGFKEWKTYALGTGSAVG